METNTKLLMTFKNEDGAKVSLSMLDPRENITEEEIKNVI